MPSPQPGPDLVLEAIGDAIEIPGIAIEIREQDSSFEGGNHVRGVRAGIDLGEFPPLHALLDDTREATDQSRHHLARRVGHARVAVVALDGEIHDGTAALQDVVQPEVTEDPDEAISLSAELPSPASTVETLVTTIPAA